MVKFIVMSFLFLAGFALQGQSISSFLVVPDYSNFYPEGASYVREYLYVVSYDESATPDTVVVHKGKEFAMNVAYYSDMIDRGDGLIEIIKYDSEGNVKSKGHRLFNDGLLVEDVDKYENESIQSMGYDKTLTYENGILTKIIDKPCDDCEVKSRVEILRDKEWFPKEVFFTNGSLGEMKIERGKVGDNYRYDYKMILSEEMKTMMEQMGKPIQEEESPYEDITISNDKKTFEISNYKADKINGGHFLSTKTKMDFEGNVLSEEEYSNNEMITQIKYLYDTSGKLKSVTDMNGEVYVSEFNDGGQYTKKREGYQWQIMQYDAKGNMIETISLGFGQSISSMVINDIKY